MAATVDCIEYENNSGGRLMENMTATRRYWIRLLPVLAWFAIFLAASGLFDKHVRIYVSLAYFLGVAIYLFVWREWRFSDWRKSLANGRAFWTPVILTTLGMAAMFGIGAWVAGLFPNADDGLGIYAVDNWAALAAFALVTILLPPIAEETFFRKAIIAFDSKAVLAVSSIVSICLYASEHSLMPLGFLQACLWAVPLTVSYVKTRNIYVSMTAHFLCNLIMNGIEVVTTAIWLLRA
jgi:membrane protease YdiL (CAAX protease family)